MARFLDFLLEARIRFARWRMLAHEAGRRAAADEFARLIRSRSAAQVVRMEAKKGLRDA